MTKKKISLFSLITLIIATIVTINDLPAAAIFGSSLIFFFALAALIFLIPTALVSAELSATFSEKGGIYQWVDRAFGDRAAFAAIWLQWISAMIWIPTTFAFIAGATAYLINPALTNNKIYLAISIFILTWGLTLLNLKGFHISTRFIHISSIIGTIIPISLIIILGVVWILAGKPIQIAFTPDALIPSFTELDSWAALVAIMFFFEGMELAGVHVGEIHNPQKNFPKAILIASIFIFFSLILSSLALAIVVPMEEINLISGVMQLFNSFFHAFGLESLMPLLTIAVVAGAVSNIINWLIAPAKGFLHAAEYGFLPPFFTHKNKAGVASRILIMQSIIISLFCAVFPFESSVNAFYWFLISLSIELYMLMYFFMFAAGIRLHYTHRNRPLIFKIPGNNIGMWGISLLGITGCLLTMIMCFFPPDTIFQNQTTTFMGMMIVGNIITLSPIPLFYLYKKRIDRNKTL